jgi:hypothetical protein
MPSYTDRKHLTRVGKIKPGMVAWYQFAEETAHIQRIAFKEATGFQSTISNLAASTEGMMWKSGSGFVASPPRRLPAKVGAHDGQHRAACKHWRRNGGSSSGTGYIYEDAEHEVEDRWIASRASFKWSMREGPTLPSLESKPRDTIEA